MAVLVLAAGSALAFVAPEPSALADKELRPAGLDAEPTLRGLAELDATDLSIAAGRLGARSESAMIDARTGRWATLLMARPLIPGNGVGNDLTWGELGYVAAPAGNEIGQAAWSALARFVGAHRAELRIDPSELVPSVGVADGGDIVQIHADRMVGGVLVRGAGLTATINHGNLVLLGFERWADVGVSSVPSLSALDAMDRVEGFLLPFAPSGYFEKPRLELLALAPEAVAGGAYSHHLVWIVRPEIDGLDERYEVAVDAHSGDVVMFQDINQYVTRNIQGGVYPITYDGQVPDGVEVPGYPMPFAQFTHPGGSDVTDAGGNLFDINGTITTQLAGPYVRILDGCGAISESSPSGDLDLGVSPSPNCDTPPGSSSAGNTHSARTGFYELNRIKEMARGHWPSGPASTWLNQQLTSNMNINQTCNAFWNGSTVNFYREGGGCGNTGQIAGVFDHEWGHGLDDNGTNGSISSPGEGIPDIYAALRLDTSCVGRGFWINGSFCGGYGDPCTPASGCTGIRDIDYANRASGQPHTVAWGNANCSGISHCLGALYAEAAWDLAKRDLPSFYGMDDNTALEVATRIVYRGADNVGAWFVTNNGTQGGCAATSGYMQFLAVDDDNGNVSDGTPHMQAIFSAFNRHQIACATPAVVDSGCASVPTQAPNVTVSPSDTGASLTWASVPNATRYKIYRTDGEFQCDFGKVIVGETTSTFFQDTGLQNGRQYSYVVAGFAASDACMGPASTCDSVVPSAGLGAANSSVEICAGTDAVYDLTVTSPFVPPVDMSLTGNPAPTTANFSPDPVPAPLPANTTLTIGNTATVAAGSYLMTATGADGSITFDLNLQLGVVTAAPGAPALSMPANGATNVPVDVTFSWSAVAQASEYQLEVATDAAFNNIIRTATGTGTSATVSPDLPSSATLYWRVRATNTCGDGAYSSVRSFSTAALPGDCGVGSVPNVLYEYGFESGAGGWTVAGSGGSNWTLSGTNPHSGTTSYFANDIATVSDQQLASPDVVLPTGQSPLTLQFWNYQELEDRTGGCYDGGILEISTNGGSSWTQLTGAALLTDPYDGPISTTFSNPLGGLDAWCGDPQPYLNSVIDIDSYAGQTVRFRFRLGTDSSVSHPGWYVDDVKVQSCVSDTMPFLDGFESGDTSAWSLTVP